MVKFIIKTFVFSILSFISVLLLYILSSNTLENNFKYKISGSPDYYIIGHSFPQCAYNDDLISNTRNIALAGEAYYYNYFKLKKILQNNPQPKAVFIEYTNNQLLKNMNDWIWDDKHISQKYIPMSPFIPLQETDVLLKNNFSGFSNGFSLALKSNMFSVLKKDFPSINDLGGYRKLDNVLTDNKDYKGLKPKNLTDKGYSYTNIEYLKKMISLRKSQDIRVILIRSPQFLSDDYYNNETQYQELLKNKLGSISYVDLSDYITSDSLFADYSHLNYKGAKKASILLDSLIKSKGFKNENIHLKL